MALALDILLYLLLGILGVLLLIILTPFTVRMEGGRLSGLGWVRGYAGVPLRFLGVGAEMSEGRHLYRYYLFFIPVWSRPLPIDKLFSRKERRPEKEREEKKDRDKTKGADSKSGDMDLFDVFYLMRTPHVRSIAGRLLRLLNPRGALEGEVGFDDPAATGLFVGALSFTRTFAPGVTEDIYFNFEAAALKGRLALGMTIWIPQIIVGAIVIALGEEGRSLIGHLWRYRKRRLAKVA
jgi:hypothetical protein